MARGLHQDDAKAVFLLASQLIEKDNSVLIYKLCGARRQLELIKRNCSKILIVDETHGTNQYPSVPVSGAPQQNACA